MTTLIVVLKSPFKLVCFVYPVRHFQGNLPFDFSQTMHMAAVYKTWTTGPWTTSVDLQSWTNVPGTVLQYSYFSVISRFSLKTVHPFQNFLAVLSLPTLYKVETLKKFWIHASNIVCGMRGGVGPV